MKPLHEHLRAVCLGVYPELVSYRTTDPRVVDAVRLLGGAADEVERLLAANAALRRCGDRMAARLNEGTRRATTNTIDATAADYENACRYIDRGETPRP